MSTVTVVTTGDTDVVRVMSEGPKGPPGPLGPWLGIIWIDGKPNSGEVIFSCEPGEALVFGADLEGWHVVARIEADAEAVARVYVNGVEAGTMTWGAQDTVPTLATMGGAEIEIGATDRFEVVMPLPADLTLADISVRMYATRP